MRDNLQRRRGTDSKKVSTRRCLGSGNLDAGRANVVYNRIILLRKLVVLPAPLSALRRNTIRRMCRAELAVTIFAFDLGASEPIVIEHGLVESVVPTSSSGYRSHGQ